VELLLDSHVLLWADMRPRALSPEARAAIIEPTNIIHVSAASVWELEMKRAAGKLGIPRSSVDIVAGYGFRLLAIEPMHAMTAAHLPRHHADPFDRMLVAQAISEGLTLVTRDRTLAVYQLPIVWA
jgi:PIN domain nuclease of toxin-antitoxin system